MIDVRTNRSEPGARSTIAIAARIAASLVLKRLRPQATVQLHGSARVNVDLTTPLGLQIYRYGFCEPAAWVMKALLKPGDVFVDGGANVGLFTVTAAAQVGPGGRVIACEPANETMELLRANVSLNGFHWVDLHQAALGIRPGTEILYGFGPGAGLSSFAPAEREDSKAEEVEVTTLDAVTDGYSPRLVKLDIEGSEVLALHGAAKLLERVRPDFIIELEPGHLERQGTSVGQLGSLFDSADYRPYRIGPGPCLTPLHDWLQPLDQPNIVVRPDAA